VNKKRILIVDDDAGGSRLLKMSLERTGGYELLAENDSARALAVAHQFRPDFIILDSNMPVVDGGAVASQLRSDAELKYVPILFLTSMVSEREAGEKSLISGAYEFMAKPVSIGRLVRHIEHLLARSPASHSSLP
jgi:PleD family two-component response regulator